METDYITSRGFLEKNIHFKCFSDGVQQLTSGEIDTKQKNKLPSQSL